MALVPLETAGNGYLEPAKALVLVIGASGVGKDCLLQCVQHGSFQHGLKTALGSEPANGAHGKVAHVLLRGDEASGDDVHLFPRGGLELELLKIDGREACTRQAPRGRKVQALLVCYDRTDRTSFLRAAHILCKHRMDCHFSDSVKESVIKAPHEHRLPPRVVSVLCGTKQDVVADGAAPCIATAAEVQDFIHMHGMAGAFDVSSKTNSGIRNMLNAVAVAVLQARREDDALRRSAEASPWAEESPASEAWSFPHEVQPGHVDHMTSPRGIRPHEPARRGAAPEHSGRLIDVLEDSGRSICAPRSLERCLERGLLHRTIHLWLTLPRVGGLLLRRRAPSDLKDPSRWGSTVQGEVLCYGTGGNGHAAELSMQAAVRTMTEQLGIQDDEVGALEHCFSTRTSRRLPGGFCKELIDVYTAPIKGKGLPPLTLCPDEEVEWAYFGDCLGDAALEAGTIFYMEDEYKRAFRRHLRVEVVQEDMENLFGRGPGARLDNCRSKPALTAVLA